MKPVLGDAYQPAAQIYLHIMGAALWTYTYSQDGLAKLGVRATVLEIIPPDDDRERGSG